MKELVSQEMAGERASLGKNCCEDAVGLQDGGNEESLGGESMLLLFANPHTCAGVVVGKFLCLLSSLIPSLLCSCLYSGVLRAIRVACQLPVSF